MMNSKNLNFGFDVTLLSRIEQAGLNASVPLQQRWLDGWLVRFSPGKAKRARCVNAVAAGCLSFEQRLVACAQIFVNAALPLLIRITPFTIPDTLDAQLEQQGWRQFDDTCVMVLSDLPVFKAGDTTGISIEAVTLDAFAHLVGDFRGSSKTERQAHAERLNSSLVSIFAFQIRTSGKPVACGLYALEGELVGLYDVFTRTESRRQGLAHTLCKHLLIQAVSRGARHAYLQVAGDNHTARSVYRRLGFDDGYAYHYRTCDPLCT